MEINGIEFSLDGIRYISYAHIVFSLDGTCYISYGQQYYGPGVFAAIHYYNDEIVHIPIKDYDEYIEVCSKIQEVIMKTKEGDSMKENGVHTEECEEEFEEE